MPSTQKRCIVPLAALLRTIDFHSELVGKDDMLLLRDSDGV
jgi:hypothetical protein